MRQSQEGIPRRNNAGGLIFLCDGVQNYVRKERMGEISFQINRIVKETENDEQQSVRTFAKIGPWEHLHEAVT